MRQVREEALDVLLFNLRHVPGVNVAHVLLGYITVDSGLEAPLSPFAGVSGPRSLTCGLWGICCAFGGICCAILGGYDINLLCFLGGL